MEIFHLNLETLANGQMRLGRRTFLTSVITVAGSVGLVACGNVSTSGNVGTSSNKRYTIGFVPGTLAGADFYVTAKDAAVDEAAKLQQNLLVEAPAQFSPILQIPIIDALVAKKVDGLVIAPCDSTALIGPLQRANDAGIKVITFDTYIGDGDYAKGKITFPLSYIGSDNALGGKVLADAVVNSIGGTGKIYLQSLQPGVSTTDQREKAFREVIDATKGAVTLVQVGYDGGDVAKASAQTSAILQAHPDLAAIASTNLFSSIGMVQAIKAVNRVRTTKVAFFDAPQQAIIDLRNGIIDLVIAQQPSEMGKMALDSMVKALDGDTGKIQKHVSTGYVVVTKDNFDNPDVQNALYKNK